MSLAEGQVVGLLCDVRVNDENIGELCGKAQLDLRATLKVQAHALRKLWKGSQTHQILFLCKKNPKKSLIKAFIDEFVFNNIAANSKKKPQNNISILVLVYFFKPTVSLCPTAAESVSHVGIVARQNRICEGSPLRQTAANLQGLLSLCSVKLPHVCTQQNINL